MIGNMLIGVTVGLVLILFIVQLVRDMHRLDGNRIMHILRDCLVLTVAAIPVGMPTVMAIAMALGSHELSTKGVIVKRLQAIEELASISILCSDKTGTLTLNELTFDEPWVAPGYTAQDVLLYAYLGSEADTRDPIESAVRRAGSAALAADAITGYQMHDFRPFDPVSKMTRATILELDTPQEFQVAKGALQVIIGLVGGSEAVVEAVNSLAKRGLRALGVARTLPGSTIKFELVGMISLLDPPRPDSAQTIQQCHAMGVGVKMITGDQLVIAKEVAARLGMGQDIFDTYPLVDPSKTDKEVTAACRHADGFAQVIPEHRYRVVELLQEKGVLVGMTGDGVNDAPALQKANVGIAVKDCTDAARSAADILLTQPGLSTIIDGIERSRSIFQRLQSYALYRITSIIHFYSLCLLPPSSGTGVCLPCS